MSGRAPSRFSLFISTWPRCRVQSTQMAGTLRRLPLFAGLSNEQFESVLVGEEVWLEPGEYLVREGDTPPGFFVQLEGKTEWTRRAGTQEVHTLTFGPEEVYYGHEPLLADRLLPVSGRALTKVRLYKLEPDTFWRMLSVCPRFCAASSPPSRTGSRTWARSRKSTPSWSLWARWPQASPTS